MTFRKSLACPAEDRASKNKYETIDIKETERSIEVYARDDGALPDDVHNVS